MLRYMSEWISLYLHCHKFVVARGAAILIVTVVCMMSSDIHMKAWEWSNNSMR